MSLSETQPKAIEENIIDNFASLECIKQLYLDSKTADAYFIIGTERIPVHKSILGAVSDVLMTMFYGQLKETGDVELNDVSVDAFKIFLKFFYFGQVKLTDEFIVELMHLGQKYNVVKCVEACVQVLEKTVNDDNVCTGLNLAILYDHSDLLEWFKEHIILSAEDVLKSVGFLECDKKVLDYILQMDVLSCSEVEVFEACMSWVKTRSKTEELSKEIVQTHLGDLIYEIRFKSMTLQELTVLVNTYDSVLSTEFRNIMNMLFIPENQDSRFNKKMRQVTWDENAIIICDRAIVESQSDIWNLNVEEITTFSSNQPLLLGGFICEKIVQEDLTDILEISIEVTITGMFGGDVDKVISKTSAKLGSSCNEVSLPKPVFIRSGIKYKICLSKLPDQHQHYSKDLLTEIQIDSNITITFYDDNVSFISELKFNKLEATIA